MINTDRQKCIKHLSKVFIFFCFYLPYNLPENEKIQEGGGHLRTPPITLVNLILGKKKVATEEEVNPISCVEWQAVSRQCRYFMEFGSGNDSQTCSIFEWHVPSPIQSLDCVYFEVQAVKVRF